MPDVRTWSWAALLAGCGPAVSEAPREQLVIVDVDGDGLDDAVEARLARDYLPYLSDDPADGCGLSGIVHRVRPHPADPAFVSIVYVRLYNEDCGLNGHMGDDEVFGISIDPRQPAPAGIVSMVAIGHQDTICEQVTACGRCPGQEPCTTTMVDGAAVPVVFASKDKHANYVQPGRCSWISCLDRCTLASTPTVPPMVNAGEPGRHLIEDLTAQGFVTRANGWTHTRLFDVGPWDTARQFGGGGTGSVGKRLEDASFVAPVCVE